MNIMETNMISCLNKQHNGLVGTLYGSRTQVSVQYKSEQALEILILRITGKCEHSVTPYNV